MVKCQLLVIWKCPIMEMSRGSSIPSAPTQLSCIQIIGSIEETITWFLIICTASEWVAGQMLESSTVWGYVKQWAVEVSWCPGPTPFEGMPWTSSWPFPALPSPVPLYVTNVTIYAWCSSTLHACVEAQNLICRNLYTQRIRRSALTQADHVGLIDCTLNFDK